MEEQIEMWEETRQLRLHDGLFAVAVLDGEGRIVRAFVPEGDQRWEADAPGYLATDIGTPPWLTP